MKIYSYFCILISPLFCLTLHATPMLEETKETISEVIITFHALSAEEIHTQSDSLMPKVYALMEVPPFELIGFILDNDDLKAKLAEGLQDPQKGQMFIQGFAYQMTQESTKATFADDLALFCEKFQLSSKALNVLVKKGDWNRLLLYSLKDRS